MSLFIQANYDDFFPDTYRGMEVIDKAGAVLHTEFSADWQHDLLMVKEWAGQQGQEVYVSSSVDNFISDLKVLDNHD